MIILERVRQKTGCQCPSLRFVENNEKVTMFHERHRKTVRKDEGGWLTTLMDWIEGEH